MRLVVLESPYKQCTKCGTTKPLGSFVSSRNRFDGKHPWCRDCMAAARREYRTRPEYRERERAYQREWAKRPGARARNLAYQKTDAGKRVKRRTKLKAKYGLTEASYDRMLRSQGGVCAVCRAEFVSTKHTHVDHCHATGRVRGILCHNCNRALGAVRDNPIVLQALIAYLGAR